MRKGVEKRAPFDSPWGGGSNEVRHGAIRGFGRAVAVKRFHLRLKEERDRAGLEDGFGEDERTRNRAEIRVPFDRPRCAGSNKVRHGAIRQRGRPVAVKRFHMCSNCDGDGLAGRWA